MDLNKLAEEVEAAGWHCDKPGAEKLIRDALARVQAEERERCARLFTDSPHIARILAALDEGPDDRDDGPMCRLCHQLMSVSDEYEPHAICWLCATKSVDELADAIRALNNAQGEQG